MFMSPIRFLFLATLVIMVLIPSAAADERGGGDPYVVITNYHWNEKLQEGEILLGEGVDPDPGRGEDYVPQYNDYDWMISDPVGIRQSELDAFQSRCDAYAQGFGVDGVVVRDRIYELTSGINSVQIVPNMVFERDDVPLKSSLTLFFPPNYEQQTLHRYPLVIQIPGYGLDSLNDMIFDPGGTSIPLGLLSTIKAYAGDPNGRGIIWAVWNGGGRRSISANSDAKDAIDYAILALAVLCRADHKRIIAVGSSRGAFSALTLAEDIIHERFTYDVIGVFASSPPLSMGTLSTIPTATNPDLSNLYKINGGADAYLYSGSNPPGSSPQPALMPAFGTDDPLAADMLCPDYGGESGGTDNLAQLAGKYVYLAAGTHDSFFPVTNFITMDRKLSERGIPHTTFLVLQGGHGPLPKARMQMIMSDFIEQVLTDKNFNPATYSPPAPYKHGIGEAARNYFLNTDLETHQTSDDQGETTMKRLLLDELPFSATMPHRMGCNVFGTAAPNVADEPGIVHLCGAPGRDWKIIVTNPATTETMSWTGVFDSTETAEVIWWEDDFPVAAAGNCGPGGDCTPGNDILQWTATYEGRDISGNTNYIIDGERLPLETEIIDRQPEPWELRVKYLDSSAPAVAIGVDDYPLLSATLVTTPASGTLPLTVNFAMTAGNNTPYHRQLAFRLDTVLAGGLTITNHRAGYTNMGPFEWFEDGVNMTMPVLQSLNGVNTFTLNVQDVTPVPYNQPPYPPAGATDTHVTTVTTTIP